MKLVLLDATGKTLGVEHIDGTRWVARDDKLLSLDEITIHRRHGVAGAPTRYVITDNRGNAKWYGMFYKLPPPDCDGVTFHPGMLALMLLEDA
jgi:hypothetical protein